jgi:5'(3')-deoxyribonucleotidase
MSKKILYVDMDDVLVDFQSAFPKIPQETLEKYKDNKDEIPGIFRLMDPMEGAIESYQILSQYFDTYILSTSPWENPTASSDKVDWIKKYLGKAGYKRLILSHHKNLNKGDYIIDDRDARGVDRFEGKHIHFGKGNFRTWDDVMTYLMGKIT